MSDVTQILSAIVHGDPHAAEQLLPLVYDEFRKLAAQKLAQEKPGQTLQATALVHEAYLRLVGADQIGHGSQFGTQRPRVAGDDSPDGAPECGGLGRENSVNAGHSRCSSERRLTAGSMRS